MLCEISEQIASLEILDINKISYLVLPKAPASVLTHPLLVIVSAFLAIDSGVIAAASVVSVAPEDYIFRSLFAILFNL